MERYVTGKVIKKLREEIGLTQLELAEILNVSDKSISKWETGRGYPDISLLTPLASALKISVIELLSGQDITNKNRNFNMTRMKFYVCPICGNVITSIGDAMISCCGITLLALDFEESDNEHELKVEKVEDEYYLTCEHEMTKEHYISFIAAVKYDGIELIKLYPEGPCEARFKTRFTKDIYYYCNKHGLFKIRVK